MGYRSDVFFKTTAEGYTIAKSYNDKLDVKGEYDKPLYGFEITKTPTGYYRLQKFSTKWYDDYTNVRHFEKILTELERFQIPYVFIRRGEELTDIETQYGYGAGRDIPDELQDCYPIVEIDDPDCEYECLLPAERPDCSVSEHKDPEGDTGGAEE